LRAEGRLLADTVFDGLIKFYDLKSNKLVRECNYKNGIRDGIDNTYYENGGLAIKGFCVNGLQSGYSYNYNKDGDLLLMEFYYYGLKVGNNIEYSHGKVLHYWFSSLDYLDLLDLDYDSLKTKQITELNTEYFFYHYHEYSLLLEKDSTVRKGQYFFYTPNPPNFDFKYSLVLIDSTYKLISVLKEFDNNRPWSLFDCDQNPKKANEKLAIRLEIMDSINNKKIGMLKVLK